MMPRNAAAEVARIVQIVDLMRARSDAFVGPRKPSPYQTGYEAAAKHVPIGSCPHGRHSMAFHEWRRGYRDYLSADKALLS